MVKGLNVQTKTDKSDASDLSPASSSGSESSIRSPLKHVEVAFSEIEAPYCKHARMNRANLTTTTPSSAIQELMHEFFALSSTNGPCRVL